MSANTYVDQDTCAGCGGRCCKRHAGALFPSDIKGPMYRGLVELLSSGMYHIDWYDKNPHDELRGVARLYHNIADGRAEEDRKPRSEGQGILHPASACGNARDAVRSFGWEDRHVCILGWREPKLWPS